MKIKIFIDHNLSDNDTTIDSLIRVQIYLKNKLVKDFLFTEIDNQGFLESTYSLVNEAVSDYDDKFIGGRLRVKLSVIEDKVQEYEVATKQYLKAV